MPKAKPTQVIVHRIELQEKERDALEAIVTGQTVKNVVVPVAVGSAVVSASYLSYKALKAAYDWGDDAVDGWKARVEKLIVPDLSEGPDISWGDGFGEVKNNETGETKRVYPLPYYWIKALFD